MARGVCPAGSGAAGVFAGAGVDQDAVTDGDVLRHHDFQAGERAEIAARAAQSGMSLSAYMRAAGLNHPVRSVLDLKAVADLGRVNGDLGQVAGLLKLWLAEKRGQGARPVDVEALMRRFQALQTELHQIIGRAVRGA